MNEFKPIYVFDSNNYIGDNSLKNSYNWKFSTLGDKTYPYGIRLTTWHFYLTIL